MLPSWLIFSRLHDRGLVIKHAYSRIVMHVSFSSRYPSSPRIGKTNHTSGWSWTRRMEDARVILKRKQGAAFSAIKGIFLPWTRQRKSSVRYIHTLRAQLAGSYRRTDGHSFSSFWVDTICCALMARSHTVPRARRSFSCQWTMNPSARGLSS